MSFKLLLVVAILVVPLGILFALRSAASERVASIARTVIAVGIGSILVVVGAVHSTSGWTAFRRSLLTKSLDDGLVDSIGLVWHLAGVCFVGFGVLTILAGTSWLRDRDGSVRVLQITGALFAAFGVAGYLLIRPSATFALFLAPGAVLFFAPPPRGVK